jgi:predicted transcriptional regulator
VAGKKPSVISGREFAILKLLWEHGSLTVREIRGHLADQEEIPYTTVLSLVQLMERKGYLKHQTQGKTYRYSPRVQRQKMTRQLLRDFIGRFFDGSPEALVMGLADSDVVDAETWEQLQGEIHKAEEPSDE